MKNWDRCWQKIGSASCKRGGAQPAKNEKPDLPKLGAQLAKDAKRNQQKMGSAICKEQGAQLMKDGMCDLQKMGLANLERHTQKIGGAIRKN